MRDLFEIITPEIAFRVTLEGCLFVACEVLASRLILFSAALTWSNYGSPTFPFTSLSVSVSTRRRGEKLEGHGVCAQSTDILS